MYFSLHKNKVFFLSLAPATRFEMGLNWSCYKSKEHSKTSFWFESLKQPELTGFSQSVQTQGFDTCIILVFTMMADIK